MLLNIITSILFFHSTDASPSSIGAFVSSSPSSRPVQSVQSSSRQSQVETNDWDPSDKNGNDGRQRHVVIQQIALDDDDELERMSKFCIDAFYRHDEDRDEGSLLSRWKYNISIGIYCIHASHNIIFLFMHVLVQYTPENGKMSSWEQCERLNCWWVYLAALFSISIFSISRVLYFNQTHQYFYARKGHIALHCR